MYIFNKINYALGGCHKTQHIMKKDTIIGAIGCLTSTFLALVSAEKTEESKVVLDKIVELVNKL